MAGLTLLHQATENSDSGIVQQLLAFEETSIDATDRHSCIAIHIAAEYGCTSVAMCLLAKCGLESNARDIYGRTAFHIIAEYGKKSITRLLLVHDAVDINPLDLNRETALCLAADAKHTAIALQILVEDRVDVDLADQTNWTALHHAVRTGNIPVHFFTLAGLVEATVVVTGAPIPAGKRGTMTSECEDGYADFFLAGNPASLCLFGSASPKESVAQMMTRLTFSLRGVEVVERTFK
ncbi:uncharacterized protein N7506_005464 [Penicillium brevicompactum]|uniref:uncharacterized protein n=1 Tax=Penicillium brevicompactum TaxID=5074 RepID=UPI002542345D|nr:uncharacterized protein N7506_005464 [Penicillium brevicompactum]KAJ5337442.1 hypothetical protein N7506_005464 [Penicillium brevicompactum]